MIIRAGFDPSDRQLAGALYWEAFGAKLGRTLGPRYKALKFLDRVIRRDHAISAYSNEGQLLGLVGFKTIHGALVGGDFSNMRAIYGTFGAVWRAMLLSMLERDIENQRFLTDGIFVTADARGQGVGQALLAAVESAAERRGYDTIRLDVIDTNPRVKALYDRNGFSSVDTQHLGPLKHIFGFQSATTMVAATSRTGA